MSTPRTLAGGYVHLHLDLPEVAENLQQERGPGSEGGSGQAAGGEFRGVAQGLGDQAQRALGASLGSGLKIRVVLPEGPS